MVTESHLFRAARAGASWRPAACRLVRAVGLGAGPVGGSEKSPGLLVIRKPGLTQGRSERPYLGRPARVDSTSKAPGGPC